MTYSIIHTTTMTYSSHTRKRLRRLLAALMLLVTLGLFAVQTASAQVPQRLAYQSLVSDQSGDFLHDGPYRITFRLYADEDAGGEALWSETQTVNVEGGLLSTFVGLENTLDLPFDQAYFLTVQLDDQPESQALPLSTAAYALKARDVEDGAVVRSISGIRDEVEIVAGDGIAIDQQDNQLIISTRQRLQGYGPTETPAAITFNPAKNTGGSLTEEEDFARLAALVATLGPGGSNTGLDAAYDAGRVITLDNGQVLLNGTGTGVGFQVKNAHMLFNNDTGGQAALRFQVEGGGTSQLWQMLVNSSGKFRFINSTAGVAPFTITETATNNLVRLDNSALKMYDASGTLKVQIDTNVEGKGRISTEELEITGGSDLAERFDITSGFDIAAPQPGMVVSIDPARPGGLTVSGRAYDRLVAGVVSGAGGIETGLIMGQQGSEADGAYPVALTGRVYVWVDAAHGAVEPGDLLTTSETPGHAMKVSDYARSQGAILGKALTGLPEGRGLVLMLVSLQ